MAFGHRKAVLPGDRSLTGSRPGCGGASSSSHVPGAQALLLQGRAAFARSRPRLSGVARGCRLLVRAQIVGMFPAVRLFQGSRRAFFQGRAAFATSQT
eukprot:2938262-Pyramimonas_sp.AAC.1